MTSKIVAALQNFWLLWTPLEISYAEVYPKPEALAQDGSANLRHRRARITVTTDSAIGNVDASSIDTVTATQTNVMGSSGLPSGVAIKIRVTTDGGSVVSDDTFMIS